MTTNTMTKFSKDDSKKACADFAKIFSQSFQQMKEIIPKNSDISDIKVDIKNLETMLRNDCIEAVEKKNARISSSSDVPLKDLQEGNRVSVGFSAGGNDTPKVNFATSLIPIANRLDGEEVQTIVVPDSLSFSFDITHLTEVAGDNKLNFENIPEYR